MTHKSTDKLSFLSHRFFKIVTNHPFRGTGKNTLFEVDIADLFNSK